MNDSRQLLLTTRLAAEADRETAAMLMRCTRIWHAEQGLDGGLLFDGLRFAALLRGPSEGVTMALERIASNARLYRSHLLADGPWQGTAGPPAWRAGYCELHDLDALEAPHPLPAEIDAVAHFEAILRRADLSP